MAAQDVTAEIHGFSELQRDVPTPWAVGLRASCVARDTFWLSTVWSRRPGPHVTPLDRGLARGGALVRHSGLGERKARNLAENPSCVLTTGRSDLVEGERLDVVLEGQAEQVTDDAELEPVAASFAVKYGSGPWDFEAASDGAFVDRGSGGRASGVPGAPCARPGVSARAIKLQSDDLAVGGSLRSGGLNAC